MNFSLAGLESQFKESGSGSGSSHHVYCDIDCNGGSDDDESQSKDSNPDLSKKESNRLTECLQENSNCLVTLTFMLFLILSSYMLR